MYRVMEKNTPTNASVDSIVSRLRNYDECHDGDIDEAANMLAEVSKAWSEYKAFLMHKYPSKDGEEWQFTCPHHRRIDSILNG